MTLEALIAGWLDRSVPPEISEMARQIGAAHAETAAVLAYGSCLRGVSTTDSLIDLYVLTTSLDGVSRNPISRIACRAVPPNVYYAECEVAGRRYRAKYAVLPIDLFKQWMTADNPYFWARFSQPAALVQAANAEARAETVAAIAQAVRTMFAAALGISTSAEPLAVWASGFSATYRTELRPESADRSALIVEANADYYRAAAALMPDQQARPANWRARRLKGRLWSVARLCKAAFTFSGGADYIVWKIERHSGHRIVLSDWQRRHPIITGVMLLPRLIKRGAVR